MDLLTNLAEAAWAFRWWAVTLTAGTALVYIIDIALHPTPSQPAGGAR
jgi:hypothetical protein